MQYLLPSFFYSNRAAPSFFLWWLTPLLLWHLVWKGLALWKSARNQQRNWFIALLIINTAGILEILYLVFFQTKAVSAKTRHQSK